MKVKKLIPIGLKQIGKMHYSYYLIIPHRVVKANEYIIYYNPVNHHLILVPNKRKALSQEHLMFEVKK